MISKLIPSFMSMKEIKLPLVRPLTLPFVCVKLTSKPPEFACLSVVLALMDRAKSSNQTLNAKWGHLNKLRAAKMWYFSIQPKSFTTHFQKESLPKRSSLICLHLHSMKWAWLKWLSSSTIPVDSSSCMSNSPTESSRNLSQRYFICYHKIFLRN